jgi:carbon-monoxide dehydrogenase large subunit
MAPSVIAGQLGARAGFYETAEVRAHPTGSITVFTGSHSHGQVGYLRSRQKPGG